MRVRPTDVCSLEDTRPECNVGRSPGCARGSDPGLRCECRAPGEPAFGRRSGDHRVRWARGRGAWLLDVHTRPLGATWQIVAPRS